MSHTDERKICKNDRKIENFLKYTHVTSFLFLENHRRTGNMRWKQEVNLPSRWRLLHDIISDI